MDSFKNAFEDVVYIITILQTGLCKKVNYFSTGCDFDELNLKGEHHLRRTGLIFC